MNRIALHIVDISPRFASAREAVCWLIANHVGPYVELHHDADGAPLLRGSELHISVSHSRRFAAIALHPAYRIGVDVEEMRPAQLRRVQSRFISLSEAAQWAATDSQLLAAWTIKEAVYKAAATPGLSLTSINLSAEPGAALLPDGRRFAVRTFAEPERTISLAIEQLTI
jgi:phosphopantetheinyl transferase